MEESNILTHEKQTIYQDDDEFLKEFDTLFNLAFIDKQKLTLNNQNDFCKSNLSNFLTSTPQSSTVNKLHDVNFEVDCKKQHFVTGRERFSNNSSSSGVSEEDGCNSNNSNKKNCTAPCKKKNSKGFSQAFKIIDSLLEPMNTINSGNTISNNDNKINRNDFNEYDNLIINPKFSAQISENNAMNSNSLVTIVKNKELDIDEFLELVKSKTKYDQLNKKCSSTSTASSTSLLSNEEKFYHHVIQRNNDDTDLDESDDFGPANSSMVEENHHNQNFVSLTSVLKSSSKIKSSLAAKEAVNNLFIDDISSIQNDIAATETCIKAFKSTKSSTRSYKRKNSNYHYHHKTNQRENLHKNLSNTLIQLLIMILAINNNNNNNNNYNNRNQIKKSNKSNYLSKLNKMRKYKYNNNNNSSYNSSSSNNSSNKNNLLNASNGLLKKAIDYQLLDLLTNNLTRQNEIRNVNSKKYCCSYNKCNSLTIEHHQLNNLYSTTKSKNNKNLFLKRKQQSHINHRLNLLEIPNIDDPLIFIDNLYDQLLARRKSDHQLENLNTILLNSSNSSSTKSTSNNFNSTIGCNLSTDSAHDEDIENEELEQNIPTISILQEENPNLSLSNPNNQELYYNQNDFSHINLYSIDTNVSDAVSLANETNLLDINQNLVDWNYDATTDICNITNNINNTLTIKLNCNLDNIDQLNDNCPDSSDFNLELNDSFNQIGYFETETCNGISANSNMNDNINRDANNNYDNSKNRNLEEENFKQVKNYESQCEIKEIEVKNSIDKISLESSSSTSIATWPTTTSLSSINTFESVSKLTKSLINLSSSSSSSISSSSLSNKNFEDVEKLNLKTINQNDRLINYNSLIIKNNGLIKPIYYVNTITNFPCNFLPLSYFLKPFNNIKNSMNYLKFIGQKSFLTNSSMQSTEPSSSCKYYNSTTNLASSTSSNLTTVSCLNSTPKFIKIIFDSVIKSIKFLIITKNVIFLPLLLFLLNSKANDTLVSSDRSLNLLTFNDTRTTIAATAIFSTLMTLYCP
jgi:hypothetical protein